jgi:hypothetical protein
MYTLATNMAPKSTKNASDNMKKDARCSWTDADDAIIVRVLRNKKNRGTSQVPAGKVKSGQLPTGNTVAPKSAEHFFITRAQQHRLLAGYYRLTSIWDKLLLTPLPFEHSHSCSRPAEIGTERWLRQRGMYAS